MLSLQCSFALSKLDEFAFMRSKQLPISIIYFHVLEKFAPNYQHMSGCCVLEVRENASLFCLGARNRDFLDCKLAAPLSFCRGFGPRFCVHWAQNEARSYFGVFRSVRRIVVFLELVFTPMAIDKKKCSLSADWTELFWPQAKTELNHRKARVYKTICVFDRSRLLVNL